MNLSVQLYTVRDQLSADPVGTLKKLKEAGLNYVEGGGSFGADSAEEGKKLLDDLGLKASATHISLDAWENHFEKSVSDAKILGCHYVILPWISEDVYSEGWDKFGERLNKIGKKVKAEGLVFAYHNHAFEFPNDGFNLLWASTDSEYVKSQLDIAWCQIGGEDPAAMIKKLKGRLPLVHLKDFDPSKSPQWTVAGDGLVDWTSTLEAISEGDVVFGAIELDESPIDPIEAVAECVKFFRSRGISG